MNEGTIFLSDVDFNCRIFYYQKRAFFIIVKVKYEFDNALKKFNDFL